MSEADPGGPDRASDGPDDGALGALVPVPLPRPRQVAATLPGLTRIAAATWLHATQWGLVTTARTTRRLVRALRDPAAARELARDLGTSVEVVLGLARAVAAGTPLPQAVATVVVAEEPWQAPPGATTRDAETLREQGADLLARSRDVWDEEDGHAGGHPAYARILGDLAPDEARVLLLLARSGPQPSVDVRTGGPVGRMSSHLVAPGLTMIGARAGCRHVDRVPAYLNNLNRLGLVWFSREQLSDPLDYQVLEAQPDVLAAMHSQRFTRVVRRSIAMTPFGDDFARAVLLPQAGPDSPD